MTKAYDKIICRHSLARTHQGLLGRPGRKSLAWAGWGWRVGTCGQGIDISVLSVRVMCIPIIWFLFMTCSNEVYIKESTFQCDAVLLRFARRKDFRPAHYLANDRYRPRISPGRHRHTDTDTQTQRHTDTHRHTQTHTYTHTHIHTYTHTHRHTDTRTHRQQTTDSPPV